MAATALAVGGQLALGIVASLGSVSTASGKRVEGLSLRRCSLRGFGNHLSLQNIRVMEESKRIVRVNAQTTETEVKSEEAQQELADAANELLKTVQDSGYIRAVGKTDDKVAISSLAVAAFVILWGSFGLVGAIDKLPFLPGLFELVGILVTGWFAYRYLIFKPDREELFKKIDEYKDKILGK